MMAVTVFLGASEKYAKKIQFLHSGHTVGGPMDIGHSINNLTLFGVQVMKTFEFCGYAVKRLVNKLYIVARIFKKNYSTNKLRLFK